jgi:hypothetical protein
MRSSRHQLPITGFAHKARVVGDQRVAALLVLAARDMAAERCRAAVLDRRHHLELAEADMAGIGLAPCRSMAAEDIRDLQRRTGQDVGRYAGGWSFRLFSCGFLGFLRGCDSRSSGLSMPAIMPVATRV